MSTEILKRALADESVTSRAVERARIAATTANARSDAAIRQREQQASTKIVVVPAPQVARQ